MKEIGDDNLEIFEFEKRDVSRYLFNTLKISKKFKKTFNYVYKNLSPITLSDKIKDISKLNWYKGKSYNWISISIDNVSLIIRNYKNHFIVYFKNVPVYSYSFH